MDIIEKLLDLQKQATLERSHYYVAGCVTEAIQEINSLRMKLHCPECGESEPVLHEAKFREFCAAVRMPQSDIDAV